jgi:prepilin-type processing-associated H-X9-DG protein/prepilin-type N-terminal cleavage/methylation domain-containing protein
MNSSSRFFSSRRAFTLLELLTTIAIVGILSALLTSSMGKMRSSADSAKCMANLRQIGVAFRMYAQENDGLYPAPRFQQSGTENPNPAGPSSTWQVELAPYTTAPLPAPNSYQLKGIHPSKNAQYCPAFVRLFPSVSAIQATSFNSTGYGMNICLNVGGRDINFGGRISNRFKEVAITRPATSIIVGDSADYSIDCSSGNWAKAAPNSAKPEGYSNGAPTRHGGKGNYLFVDGHIETLAPADALPKLVFNP